MALLQNKTYPIKYNIDMQQMKEHAKLQRLFSTLTFLELNSSSTDMVFAFGCLVKYDWIYLLISVSKKLQMKR